MVELHDAYRGICAYSCHWIPYDTGGKTVEHFMAKSHFPNQAYEWSNFRLVCSTLNGRKGTNNILDPFAIGNGWFVIDFPSLLVKPSIGLPDPLAQQVRETITSLGLNDEGTCLKGRERYIKNYCKNLVDFEYLRQEAPFIAQELERQDLVLDIVTMMDYS